MSLHKKLLFLSFRARIYQEHIKLAVDKCFFLYTAANRVKIE